MAVATLGAGYQTLLDCAKALDPDHSVAKVAEVMNKTNDVLASMSWKMGNLPLGNRVTLRSSVPTPDWRRANRGASRKKSTRQQFTDTIGVLEMFSDVDERDILPGVNVEAYRWSEAQAIIEGFAQKIADTVFYGNESTTPDAFTGIAPRYAALSGGLTSANVISAGGASTLTSIYFVTWGDEFISGCFPIGSTAGLKKNDLGYGKLYDASLNPYMGYSMQFVQEGGITLKDWRYCARLCNINSASPPDAPTLTNLMVDAYYAIPRTGLGKTFIYANAKILALLHKHAATRAAYQLGLQDWAGRPTTHFLDIPILRCDAILNTETQIS